MRSVSAASSGVSVSRSSPLASTCVRSASATVRCARCSTSRTPMPRSRIVSQRREDEVDDRRSEPERRLVEEEDRRPRDERSRDRELLLLPAGQRARMPVPELLDDREQLGDLGEVRPPTPFERGRAASPSRRFSSTVSSPKSRPPLRDERDPAPRDRLGRAAAQRPVAEADLAAARRDEPHDRVQRRRLPRAVRADQPDDLAGRDARARARGRQRRRRRRPRGHGARASAHSCTADSPRYAAATSMFPRISLGEPSASVRPWSSTWMRSQTSMISAML